MSILDNELVRKYFGCEPGTDYSTPKHEHGTFIPCIDWMGRKVLAAMQEPIRKGESYLNFANMQDWIKIVDSPKDVEGYHPWGLRLSDKYQPSAIQMGKKECDHQAT